MDIKNKHNPKQTTVILVDDDKSVREGLTALLDAAGYVVISHASGRAFLNSKLPEPPFCLLLDLDMPQMSGTDVLSEMQKRELNVPTVVITGTGKTELLEDLSDSFDLSVLTKPIAAPTLFSAIEKALADGV